jgi:hypothetical protein
VVRVIGRSFWAIPWFVKVVLLVQAVVIVGLSAWIYNEYVNNQYLQMYLISLFQGRGSLIAVLGLGGLLVTALIGILLKAGNTLGEIEHLSERVEHRMGVGVTKSGPERPMPVLKIVETEPVDEVGRLHGSLRRWNEQHRKNRKATP